MEDLIIAAAADEAFARPALTALLSAASRCSVSVRCLLVADDISAGTKHELSQAFAAHGVPHEIVEADLDRFAALPVGLAQHLTRAAYARLLVPSIASHFAARTLYLDCDTLTLGDVAELARWELGDATVGAAVHGLIGHWYAVPDWESRGFNPDARYFNTGVLVVDNERWIRDDVTAETIDLLAEHPELILFADQGALNTILYGRWATIPERWNFVIPRSPSIRIGPLAVSRRRRVNLRRVRILHYFEGVKPWDRRYPPGALLKIYRSAWRDFTAAPLPAPRSYIDWLRDRHALAG